MGNMLFFCQLLAIIIFVVGIGLFMWLRDNDKKYNKRIDKVPQDRKKNHSTGPL